jgi:hypothetical protein
VCTRHIPDKLTDLAMELVEHLGAFIGSMKQRKDLRRSKSYRLVVEKLMSFEKSLENATPLINLALEGQKEANRVFTPAITQAMVRAYAKCQTETGKWLWFFAYRWGFSDTLKELEATAV